VDARVLLDNGYQELAITAEGITLLTADAFEAKYPGLVRQV
jgi:hypothetical protein